MRIDIWADLAHLDSYLAKVALESALAEWDGPDEVKVAWHSHQVERPSTYDAHRLVHLAAAHGRGDVARELMMRSFVTEQESPTDRAVLRRLGLEAGLAAEDVDRVLDSDEHGYDVRVDEATGSQIGFGQQVPYMAFDRKYGVAGPQPTAVYLAALQYTHEHADEPVQERAAATCGGACGSCGCGA